MLFPTTADLFFFFRKSHQNKFHAKVLQDLTSKFASMEDGDGVAPADKELWEYFSTLYKNSNKGIKGRGKDRRIQMVGQAKDNKIDNRRNIDRAWGSQPRELDSSISRIPTQELEYSSDGSR
jgi:hypothetical protein